jgi:hypothetical protein
MAENSNGAWQHQAACRDGHLEFFDFTSTAQKTAAKKLCFSCPVRMECLQDALKEGDFNGMWGGIDETELRRALSVNKYGMPVNRGNSVRCPNCRTEQLQQHEKRRNRTKVHCANCKLTWWTRRSILKRPRTTTT